MTIFVLWENHATGSVDRFGPHAFLLACVADRLQMNRFELHAQKIISGRSCSGNSNVLRQLGRRPLWDAALHLIAVLDSDKLHDLLGGEARKLVVDPAYEPWSAQMEARCRERLGPHDVARLTICFLDRNLETLLKILGDTSVEKDVVQRDKVLQSAADNPVLIRRGLERCPRGPTSSIPSRPSRAHLSGTDLPRSPVSIRDARLAHNFVCDLSAVLQEARAARAISCGEGEGRHAHTDG